MEVSQPKIVGRGNINACLLRFTRPDKYEVSHFFEASKISSGTYTTPSLIFRVVLK